MSAGVREPSMAELTDALHRRVGKDGAVPAGIAVQLKRENGWGGHLMDVLGVFTRDVRRMGYLAGGRLPGEVATWLAIWAASPLSVEQIQLIVDSGGWDPEPFVVLANAGILEACLRCADGSHRRIRGELAGAWVSDQLTLADDDEIVRQVRKLLEEERVLEDSSLLSAGPRDASSPPRGAPPLER